MEQPLLNFSPLHRTPSPLEPPRQPPQPSASPSPLQNQQPSPSSSIHLYPSPTKTSTTPAIPNPQINHQHVSISPPLQSCQPPPRQHLAAGAPLPLPKPDHNPSRGHHRPPPTHSTSPLPLLLPPHIEPPPPSPTDPTRNPQTTIKIRPPSISKPRSPLPHLIPPTRVFSITRPRRPLSTALYASSNPRSGSHRRSLARPRLLTPSSCAPCVAVRVPPWSRATVIFPSTVHSSSPCPDAPTSSFVIVCHC